MAIVRRNPTHSHPKTTSLRPLVRARSRNRSTESEYEVGYKRPPKATQFKSGQSGNPKGRPKGAKSLEKMALQLLKQPVNVKSASGMRKVSRIEALLMKQLEKAGAGDAKALKILLDLYDAAVSEERAKASEKDATASSSPSDTVILQLMRDKFAAERVGDDDDTA